MRMSGCGRRQTGMSLAEVMLSVALLGLILVSVIGLFHSLLSSTSKSGDLTAATVLAQQKLNQMVADQPRNLSIYGTDFPTDIITDGIYTHDTQTATEFYSRATPELLYTDPAIGKAYYVEITVYWWTADKQTVTATRGGHGRQFIKMGRMVYVPNPS